MADDKSIKIKVKLTKKINADHYKKTVNSTVQITLFQYLWGVCAAQCGGGLIQTHKVQAIASRTTAYPYYSKGIQISDASPQAFNASRLTDTYINAKQGVIQTNGMLVCYKGTPCSPCSFSSNNGGKTVSSQTRWGGKRAWLIEQIDQFDSPPKKGHGVGMSQKGTANRVKAGQSYLQILSFYYPNTQILGSETNDVQINFVKKKAKELLNAIKKVIT